MRYAFGVAAALLALCVYAPPAVADDLGPVACTQQGVTVPSNLAGPWRPRQRDDGAGDQYGEWHDVATHQFATDGAFSETSDSGTRYGHWCVYENVLIWGFDTLEHTTWRVPLGAEPMRGTMSWDGGGTGEVEIRR
ncbi:MAG: hypothetical protein KF779_13470 [Hyphomonadaceae bacterium]|nr:hypothetical protein [Hyphomonadaceae bacterium]